MPVSPGLSHDVRMKVSNISHRDLDDPATHHLRFAWAITDLHAASPGVQAAAASRPSVDQQVLQSQAEPSAACAGQQPAAPSGQSGLAGQGPSSHPGHVSSKPTF